MGRRVGYVGYVGERKKLGSMVGGMWKVGGERELAGDGGNSVWKNGEREK